MLELTRRREVDVMVHISSAVAIWLVSATAWSPEFTRLGSFSDVGSSDGGEHCSGYSLALWKSGTRVIGLLDVHEGLCGDPPCGVLQNVTLDGKTGRLRFWALIDTRWEFDGMLNSDAVVGTLGGERVRLARDRDQVGMAFGPDQSLLAWCAFWRSVGRCGGVRELCASLGISQ